MAKQGRDTETVRLGRDYIKKLRILAADAGCSLPELLESILEEPLRDQFNAFQKRMAADQNAGQETKPSPKRKPPAD